MRIQPILVFSLAIMGSVFVGYIDSHATEVMATLMVMLPITFILGFVDPKRAVLWALIIGLSVPASYFIGLATGQHYADPPASGYMTLIALVPAFIGTFAGVIFRYVVRQVLPPANPHAS